MILRQKKFFQKGTLSKIESYVDCWFFCLKQTDPILSKEMTGADFEIIKQNFYYLGEKDPNKIIIRTPLIYPVTSDRNNIENICKLMNHVNVIKTQLLKYNPYTSIYYTALGIPFEDKNYCAVDNAELEEILSVFRVNNVECSYVT